MKKYLLEEENDIALNKKEIILFKFLNKNKKELGKKSDLIDTIRTTLRTMGMSENDALLYYYAYTANYRPEGDYENLTKSEFKDYKTFKQKRTTNVDSWQFSRAKIPFKGSNLEGYWDVDDKNVWYYVVKSYGWYPIFLFKYDRWYEVSNRYSSSTGKHIGGARPTRYVDELKSQVTFVSHKEITLLMHGDITHDELFKGKRSRLESQIKSSLINIPKFVTWGYGGDAGKAKFKVVDVKQVDEKVLITIEILEAGRREGKKLVKSDVPYSTGQIPQATPSIVQTAIKDKINRDFYDIIGSRVWSDDEKLPDDYFLIFKFK